MTTLDNDLRERVKRFLPHALEKVMASHRANAPAHPYNPKKRKHEPLEVKRHHDACKSALSHIQLLINLAKDIEKEDGSSSNDEKESLKDMLIEAKREIDIAEGNG